ncbi:hypothetical protein ScPMuIL_000581 [Solemya velum]
MTNPLVSLVCCLFVITGGLADMDFSRLFFQKYSLGDSRGKAENCAGGNFSLEWEPKQIDPEGSAHFFLDMIAPASFSSGVVSVNVWIPDVKDPIIKQTLNIDCSLMKDYIKECPIKKGAHITKDYQTSKLSRLPSGTFIGRMEIHNEKGELVICFKLTLTILGEKK